MITDFLGEFLFHPAPLEVSGNTCSHNCCYCFANIRGQARYMDLKSVIRQINKSVLKTYTDNLLREGYPICISNKTDPFSKSNYIQSIALAHQLSRLNNGIFIQTKGGIGIEDFISAFNNRKDIVFYITITTLNESIRKRIEPGAPTTQERIDLAAKLKKAGYHVIIAVNPILEKWMPERDLIELINICKSLEIYDLCTEGLHLNKKEVESFSSERLNHFEQSEIDIAINRKSFQDYVKKCIPIISANGMNVVKLGMPFKSNFYDGIKKVFPHIFPNQIDLINHSHNIGTGLYSFDEFYEVSIDNKPFFEREFKEVNRYLLKASIRAWAEKPEAKSIFTLKGVLNEFWNNSKYPQSLQRNQAYRTLVDEKNIPIKDEKNNILLYFDKGIYPTERIINIKNIKNEKF